MMIGVPDYDNNYVEHMRITHPDQTPMTREEFFRERRQDARYGGKGGARCCRVAVPDKRNVTAIFLKN
ncbi:putative selenoprotein [Salmonella enterica subsp. enterica]|nr:putative selenoprotein [Salmonella enterica subsp. enterica]